MQELFFTANAVFLIFSILLAIYIISNYHTKLYRAIGMIPLSVCLIVGYAKSWILAGYNNIANLIGNIPANGMITVDNHLSLFPYVKLAIFLITAIAVVIGLYLVFDNTYKTILAETLLFGGTASRVIIGFTPSIWVSGDRTYLFLYFCLLMISLMIIKQMKEENLSKSWHWSLIYYTLVVLGILSFLNMLASA